MLRWLLRLAARLALLGLLAACVLAGVVFAGLPSRSEVRALAKRSPTQTSVMRQREQQARARGREARSVVSFVPISRISRDLIHAVLASEDQRFFGHQGVDWEAIQQSAEANWEKGRLARGGSTITQQLAKNLFFTTDKSLLRKLQELVVARWLEDDLSKRRILELYLNVIEWGDGLYGCEAAARRYYAKPCAELGPREAAGMAAMIPNPRRINPRVSPARHARAERRVLWLMARAGYIRKDAAGLGSEPPPLEPADEAETGAVPGDDEAPDPPPPATISASPGPG